MSEWPIIIRNSKIITDAITRRLSLSKLMTLALFSALFGSAYSFRIGRSEKNVT
jgi:hypothetical protein